MEWPWKCARVPRETGGLPRVVVTGLGPVSAVGCGRDAFYEALISGRHGFGPITRCELGDSPSRIGAEVREFSLGRYVERGELLARGTPRGTQLALAAAVLALHDAELDLSSLDPERFAMHVGTGVGNLEELARLVRRREAGQGVPAHAAFLTLHHSAACVLSSFFDARGPVLTTTSGCNSGVDALGSSLRMLQAGAADLSLVVGTDSELVPEILAGLNASSSLVTRYNDEPGRASRPFDLDRDGNVIGEGAGALVLETEAHARARGARIYARLAGYGLRAAGRGRRYSHDAPDLDPEPAVRALRAAIVEAGWTAEQVHLVSANGSSSRLYDALEARALQEVLGAAIETVPVHSIKSMLGQHGAGSSALQAICACLTIRRGVAPPTLNCERLDPACAPLNVLTQPELLSPRRVLMHSIGLGGFYYSAAAFERESAAVELGTLTGRSQVRWSPGHHPRFPIAQEFSKPLSPWEPPSEDWSLQAAGGEL